MITTQPPAEYGGRAGGVINVITKSGTNIFSGEGYEFFRNKPMGRLDKFTQASEDAGQGKSGTRAINSAPRSAGRSCRTGFTSSWPRNTRRRIRAISSTQGQPQFYGKFEGVFDQRLPNQLFFVRDPTGS